MIVVDANLLSYAVDSDSPHHRRALAWLEQTLSRSDPVGLAWVVLLAFIRITTRPGVLRRQLSPEAALDYVESWPKQPCVETISPGRDHWRILRSLLAGSGTAGNLTSDAHLAAMAIEHGATLCSADNDFRRFAGLVHSNPLK